MPHGTAPWSAPPSRRLRAGSAPTGALVSLPRPSPLVEALCVALYVLLALVAAWSLYRRRRFAAADRQPRKQSFQSFMIAFGVARALSFLTRDIARDLLNRLALCLFFSLVLFQVLFWIDIANPKRSTRSRRIWNAFLIANAGFYAMLLGMSALHSLELRHAAVVPQTPLQRIADARAFDLGPVLFIALGSLASSLGLLYSTCKTRRRIGRVLRHTAAKARQLPRRVIYDRVTSKLRRALRVTNLIMGVCSVLFLLRTVLYIQRPFSHKECGAIRDPNACILIGYGLPELVPCFLFLLLMAQVEPDLELPSRRKSSLNVAAVARATESTPLLLAERDPELVIDTSLGVTTDQSIDEGDEIEDNDDNDDNDEDEDVEGEDDLAGINELQTVANTVGKDVLQKEINAENLVILERYEATLLINHHNLRAGDRDHVTTLLRTHGVRRENARKNIGRAQYCFSALQNYLLPTDYQCPPGTGGGSSALS
ncbi:hypothetical protein ATCC90586_004489 [Pythium insidiosum]|nr:hypothetical protein ATCC90586_004489 [Pythium insidiosum]